MSDKTSGKHPAQASDTVEYVIGGVVFVLIIITWLLTLSHG